MPLCLTTKWRKPARTERYVRAGGKAAWAFAENQKSVQTGCFDHFGSRQPPGIAAESEAPF